MSMKYDKFSDVLEGTAAIKWVVQGWGILGLDVGGAFTGAISIAGSNNGTTWTTITSRGGDEQISGEGHYSYDVAGFAMVKLAGEAGFDGTAILRALVTRPAGMTGPIGVFEDLILRGIEEGLLYNPGNGQPIQRIANGAPGEILYFRGPGLPPIPQLPQEIQAFVTGSPLAANPDLANPAARFNAIDHADGILAFAAGVPAAGDLRGIAYGAGVYVRVGAGGLVETSPDLKTWTTRTSNTANMLNSVIWVERESKFVAVGEGGTVITSPDGVTPWTVQTVSVNSVGINSVADNGTTTVFVTDTGAVSGSPAYGYSTDLSSWTVAAMPIIESIRDIMIIIWSGKRFYAGNTQVTGERLHSSLDGIAWSTPNFSGNAIFAMTSTASYVFAYNSGTGVWRSPNDGSAGTWTNIANSDVVGIGGRRMFVANGYIWLVGGDGTSQWSADEGVTWYAGPPTGTTNFIRLGIADPADPRRAIMVGDNGVMLEGKFPFRASVYGNATDRSNRANALGEAFYAYSNTPLQVEIAGQITYQTGIIGIGDVPIEFDVVTIADMVFELFAANNPSLTPGPYRCFNAFYNFGLGRWEYGPEATDHYACVEIFDASTGMWKRKMSSAKGAAGQEIGTWVEVFGLAADGTPYFPVFAGGGDGRTLVVNDDGSVGVAP